MYVIEKKGGKLNVTLKTDDVSNTHPWSKNFSRQITEYNYYQEIF